MTNQWMVAAALLIAGLATELTPQKQRAAAEVKAEAEIGEVLPIEDLQAWMNEAGVPGVSISLIKDFEIHGSLAFGMADVDSGRLVTTETLFQAASISKPVMAVASAVLAEQNHLDLDADVTRYLHSWTLPHLAENAGQPITPRMLLSHTSGLADGLGFPGYRPSEPLPDALSILKGTAPAKTPAIAARFAPMTQSRYSGGGSVLMQLLLTDVTGQSFPELMRLNLLEPLGMNRSFYQQPLLSTMSHEAALAHNGQGKRFSIPWKIYPELAAAGLWSTANDLAELVRSLQKTADGDAVMPLSKQMVRDLLRPVGIGSFGTGFNVYQQGEGWYFSHMGVNQGYRSFLIGHQSKGYGLVVMTNSDGGFALIERICQRIQQSYNWDVLRTQRAFRFGQERGLGCLPESELPVTKHEPPE